MDVVFVLAASESPSVAELRRVFHFAFTTFLHELTLKVLKRMC